MSEDKQPRAELIADLERAEARVGVANLKHENDRKNREPEAVALEGCIKALRPFANQSTSYNRNDGDRAAVERILTHLRTKHGITDPADEVKHLRARVQELQTELGNHQQRLHAATSALTSTDPFNPFNTVQTWTP